MPSATDIANWIVMFRAEGGAPVDPMSLQKLMFYSNAFCLAQTGEPLFREKFKAWKNGPVIPQVWHDYKANDAKLIVPDHEAKLPVLEKKHEQCVHDTVEFFSRVGPFVLSDSTHHETPWLNARGNRSWHESSDTPIAESDIREYYAGLINDGEEAFSRHQVMDLVPEPRVGQYYRAGICVRKMTAHPLYNMELAQVLLAPIKEGHNTAPSRLTIHPRRRDFVTADDL